MITEIKILVPSVRDWIEHNKANFKETDLKQVNLSQLKSHNKRTTNYLKQAYITLL